MKSSFRGQRNGRDLIANCILYTNHTVMTRQLYEHHSCNYLLESIQGIQTFTKPTKPSVNNRICQSGHRLPLISNRLSRDPPFPDRRSKIENRAKQTQSANTISVFLFKKTKNENTVRGAFIKFADWYRWTLWISLWLVSTICQYNIAQLIITPHLSTMQMRPIVTDGVACMVCLSICRSVGLSQSWLVSLAKTAEPTEMSFVVWRGLEWIQETTC